jgi:hypothetical protein
VASVAAGCSNETELADPAATGRELVTEFLTLLGTEEAAGLDDFLAEGFQLQRADGTGATRAEYLDNHAVVESFTIGESLIAVQQDDLLTVRWSVVVDETVEGTEFSSDEAPRLSVFVLEDGDWKMLAHANFNRPA